MITIDGKCGPNNGNKMCPIGQCCSKSGTCGGNQYDMSGDECVVSHGYNGNYDGKYKPDDYNFVTDDGSIFEHDGKYPILYGMNENLLVKVDAEKGQVACLPKYQNNGLPYFYINSVLPTMSVNDPMPNVRKMCYVKK